ARLSRRRLPSHAPREPATSGHGRDRVPVRARGGGCRPGGRDAGDGRRPDCAHDHVQDRTQGMSGVPLRRTRAFPWIPAGLALVAAAYFFGRFLNPAFIDRHAIATMNSDTYTLFYPMQKHFFDEVRAGRFPLWNPYSAAGLPFFA